MNTPALVFLWIGTIYFLFLAWDDFSARHESDAEFALIADLGMAICGIIALAIHYFPSQKGFFYV